MGNCFSDPSKPPGKGQVLGTTPTPTPTPKPNNNTGPTAHSLNGRTGIVSGPPQNLGSAPSPGGTISPAGETRERALKAAEERARVALNKGVSSSNPNSGKLSAKLQAERKNTTKPDDGRMMDAGQWN